MKNKIEDLRNHLFATLEDLRDKEAPMELERARAIATVAQTIVNTAKVEVEFVKATGRGAATGFIPEAPALEQKPGTTPSPRLVKGSAQS